MNTSVDNLTLQVPEIFYCLEVSTGVRLTLPFNDTFYNFFKF